MELLMKIDARPCNMAPEGNNIFPRRFINNYGKKPNGNVIEITFFNGKSILHVPLHHFQGAKLTVAKS